MTSLLRATHTAEVVAAHEVEVVAEAVADALEVCRQIAAIPVTVSRKFNPYPIEILRDQKKTCLSFGRIFIILRKK